MGEDQQYRKQGLGDIFQMFEQRVIDLEQQLQDVEQHNAQLKSDLAQREADCAEWKNKYFELQKKRATMFLDTIDRLEADCAGYRDILNHCRQAINAYIDTGDMWLYDMTPKELSEKSFDILFNSTSSGKDMLENMRVMREALYYYANAETIYAMKGVNNLAKETLVKVKGGA